MIICVTALQIKVFNLGLQGGTLRDQHCQDTSAVTLHLLPKIQEKMEFIFLYPTAH